MAVQSAVGTDAMLKGWGWGWCFADDAWNDESPLNGGLSVREGLGGYRPQIGWGCGGGIDVEGAHGQWFSVTRSAWASTNQTPRLRRLVGR